MSASSAHTSSAGRRLIVRQVVTGNTTTQATNSTTTYADTGLTASITPRDAKSKILVIVAQSGVEKSNANSSNGCWLKLVRDSTDLVVFGYAVGFTGAALRSIETASAVYVDEPATSSSVTYKTQFKNNVAAARVAVQVDTLGADSRITLIELATI